MRIDELSTAKLLIVGDVMLDRYWFGDVERISPEAPVPVVRIQQREERPGGAANVARNVAALGGKAILLSVVGDDEAGRSLLRLLAGGDIELCLHVDSAISTTVKLRVIGRQQQLLRIDFETVPSHEVLRHKLAAYVARLPDCDAVILSDYGKGGLAHIGEMIRMARERGKMVLVDPKGDDFSKYAGATIVTPNRSELRTVVGRWRDEEELARKAEALRADLGLEGLLLTRSEEGMSLYHRGGVLHEKAVAREVFDVSGAGDTVIAALAVMLAGGASWVDAVHVANAAAGVVVGKLGTAVASRGELAAAMK